MMKIIGNSETSELLEDQEEESKEEVKQCSLEESCRLANHGCQQED